MTTNKIVEPKEKFTKEDLCCWEYFPAYLINILNGEYDLQEAREDLRCLIGTIYDPRKSALKEKL